MKTALSYVLVLLTFVTLTFLPNSFAQETLLQPSVRLVYFLPNDRPTRADRVKALRQLIIDVQQFYAEQMEYHGYGGKTFAVETDKKGEPLVHHIDGKFAEEYYYKEGTGYKVWEEILEHFNNFQHIYFTVIDLSSEILHGGKTCGEASLYFSPMGEERILWRTRNTTQEEEVLGGFVIIPASGVCFEENREYRHRLGTPIHELGHTFGLDHDFREGPNSDYVMAYGHQSRLSKCAAEWLSVSCFFNSGQILHNDPAKIQILSPQTHGQDTVNLRFEVTDPDGLHQAQLLVADFFEGDGWGAHRLFDCKRLNGETSIVESDIRIEELVDSVALQITDVSGHITWATFPIDVSSLLPPPKVVSIPDPNLERAIRAELGLATLDTITDRAMRKLKSLNVDGRGITNIAGLEYATQLEMLSIGKNQIDNYDRLSQLPKLTKLYLWNNNIKNLKVLPPLLQLGLLDLNWNQISDVSPLAEFTSLKELWLQGNKLADTSTLFQLHSGAFPPDEEVEVVKERDRSNRAYTLLTFQSLDLKVRINPNVTVYRSLNAVQNARQTVTAANELVEKTTPATNVLVEEAGHPPMYWINTETGTLHRLVDTEVEDLVPRVRNATSLAVDVAGGKLYWTERTGDSTGRIRRANLDGTNVQLVKELKSVPHGIALDAAGRKLYWTASSGKIKRANLNGSGSENVVPGGLESPKGLALDVSGGKVYWMETPGRIRRANLNGSNIENVITVLSPSAMNIAVFDNTVYWTQKTGENHGEIRFIALGKNPRVMIRNTFTQSFPVGIAVDAVENKLYWTTSNGEIGRQNLDGSNLQSNFVMGLGAPGVLALSVETPVDIETKEVPVTDAVLSISPSPVISPAIGEQLTLSLKITAGEAVAGYQFTVQFDPTALRYVESSNGEYLPTGAFFVQPVVNRDRVELAATALAGVSKGDGTLATIIFEVLTVKASTLTLSEMLLSDSQGNTFLPQVEGGEITEPPKLKGDVNGDGVVNIQDLVLVASSFGKTGQDTADINGDGVVNIADLVLVAGSLGTGLGAPSLYPGALETFTAADVREWLSQAHRLNSSHVGYQRGMLVLEQLLAALTPKETILLANYPNPFNPETWIPYQLSKPADVTLTIYAVNGQMVRRLALGHQPAGIYQTRGRAAYWDGKNEYGEPVASSVYFYTLTAGGFTATRKMLIRK